MSRCSASVTCDICCCPTCITTTSPARIYLWARTHPFLRPVHAVGGIHARSVLGGLHPPLRPDLICARDRIHPTQISLTIYELRSGPTVSAETNSALSCVRDDRRFPDLATPLFSFLVHRCFSDLGENLVRIFLFFEGLREQCRRLVQAEFFSPASHGAVPRDLVVLDSLSRREQPGV